jgi:two-component system sensor histidine kinase RegB
LALAELTDINQHGPSHNLRLITLINVRWLAVLGQASAIFIVWQILEFSFEPVFCFALVCVSIFINFFLRFRYPANQRLSSRASAALLAYDIIQLAILLFLTGGLQNPFSILLLVPVVISATALSIKYTVFLGLLAVLCTSLLAFFHLPLPWVEGEELQLPNIYIGGMWFAIISSLSFTAVYAFRVADEARKLSDALTATELVLQREQHLTNLDGLAAAAAHELGTPLATIALVSKEMTRELKEGSELYEDAALLRSQAERCRDILQKLTSLSSEGDRHIGTMPFTAFMEEIAEPHRNFGVSVVIDKPDNKPVPECIRNAGILYGLGNIVENAVDYAKAKVLLSADWDEESIWVKVTDDGRGIDDEVLARIGEPFVTKRSKSTQSGGLGLGLFIAKTLLERSGATLVFGNDISKRHGGAAVLVKWPRSTIEAARD